MTQFRPVDELPEVGGAIWLTEEEARHLDTLETDQERIDWFCLKRAKELQLNFKVVGVLHGRGTGSLR